MVSVDASELKTDGFFSSVDWLLWLSSPSTPPVCDLHVPVFTYAAPHTRSHLPLHDNDGKQEGQWQMLVFTQVEHLSVIVHFDCEVFAKDQAPLQRRRECLPKTPRLLK